MDPQLLRHSLKLAVAALLTAAVAMWWERIAFLWYPLLAVVVVVDDNDDQTLRSASGRILGTLTGGLVTFVVHTVLDGWIGVLVSLLILLPLLRCCGWQASAGTATLVSVMFLSVAHYAALDWTYVLDRSLDTAVGCLIAIGVGLLFWPRNGLHQLQQLEEQLRASLAGQLGHYDRWLRGEAGRPQPLAVSPLSEALLRMEQLVQQERRGPHRRGLAGGRWPQRLLLWQAVHHHWIQWERQLGGLELPGSPIADPTIPGRIADQPIAGRVAGPLQASIAAMAALLEGGPPIGPERRPGTWQALAAAAGLPLLPLLALAEEQYPLQASLSSLALLRRATNVAPRAGSGIRTTGAAGGPREALC